MIEQRDQLVEDDQKHIDSLTKIAEKLKAKLKAAKAVSFTDTERSQTEDEYQADDEENVGRPHETSDSPMVCGVCGAVWDMSATSCPKCKSTCAIVDFDGKS